MSLSSREPLDVVAWLESRGVEPFSRRKNVRTSDKSHMPEQPKVPRSDRSKFNKARYWLSKCPGAVEGQDGRVYTCAIAKSLIKGFDLSGFDAMSLLMEWNPICQPPWSEKELAEKIEYVESLPDDQPRGYLIKDKMRFREAASMSLTRMTGEFEKEFEIRQNAATEEGEDDEKKSETVSDEFIFDTAYLARLFREENMSEDGVCLYVWWNEYFYEWNGNHYIQMNESVFRSQVAWFVESCFNKHYFTRVEEERYKDKPAEIKKHKVTTRMINDVMMCIVRIIYPKSAQLDESDIFWIKQVSGDHDVTEIMPFSNGLIHVDSYISGRPDFRSLITPRLFSSYSLKYKFPSIRYNGPVQPPPRWTQFLEEVWEGDIESIECLQEWFGYLLLQSNKHQKMLLMVGPRRSGKGTTLRVIERMVGKENICNPTFSSFAARFPGSQQLIGKTIAIFSDARVSNKTDITQATEKFLSISGGDRQTVDRKFLVAANVVLNCRFVIASNETPRFIDNSGALASRFVALKFTNTFFGNEDINLFNSLVPEIPDILMWSIDGLKRLNERGYFLQPKSGEEILGQLAEISSPIAKFKEEELVVGDTFTCYIHGAYGRWVEWCSRNGYENPGNIHIFGRNLHSIIPQLQTKHVSENVRMYVGIKFRETDQERALRIPRLYGDMSRGFESDN